MRQFMAPPPRIFRLLPGTGGSATGGDPRGPRPARRCDRYAERDRIASASAAVGSVLLHALVILLWPAVTISAGAPFDPDAAFRAAPRPVQVVRVREPQARDPTPLAAETRGRPRVSLDLPAVTRSDPGPPPSGPALEPAAAVRPDVVIARPRASSPPADVFVRPVALSILTNWKPVVPSAGIETTVRVHTDATGRATGLVELVPLTSSHRLDAEIIDRVRQLEFQPATSGGRPTAAWAEITLVICPDGVTATSPASPSGLPDPCARDSSAAAETGG